MKKNNFIKLIFLDLPILKGVEQTPIWLFWLNVRRITIFFAFIILFFLIYNLENFSNIKSIQVVIDLIVLFQPFLAIAYGEKVSEKLKLKPSYTLFILMILCIILLDDLTEWRDFIPLSKRTGDEYFRFTFLSAEPSYFAEILIIMFFVILLKNKFHALIFICLGYLITRSNTLLQSLFIFYVLRIPLEIILHRKKIYFSKNGFKSFLITFMLISIILFNTEIVKNIAIYLQENLGSWRLSSNVLAIQNSNFLPLEGSWRDEIYSLFLNNNVFAKYAIFSILPYLMFSYGYIITLIYIYFLVNFIVNKHSLFKFKATHLSILLYVLFHCFFLTPKYNTSILLIIPLIFSYVGEENSIEVS